MKKIVFAFALLLILSNISFAAMESEAYDAIKKAQNAIDFMKVSGLGTNRVDDLMNDAKLSFENKDYEKTILVSNGIISLKEKALSLKKEIDDAKNMLELSKSLGIVAEYENKILDESVLQFNEDNYELSESSLITVQSSLNLKLKTVVEELKNSLDLLIKSANDEGFSMDAALQLSEKFKNMLSNLDFSSLDLAKKDADSLILALEGLHRSKNDIDEMSRNNFKTSKANDLYNDAKIMFEFANYQKSISLSEEIKSVKDKAFLANIEMLDAKSYIEEISRQGVDVSDSRSLMQESLLKFENEDFIGASSLAKNSMQSAQDSKKSSLLLGIINRKKISFDIVQFIKRNFAALSISLIVILALAYPSSFALRKIICRKKLNFLEKEEKIITSMIKKTQEDYFKNKKLGKVAYDSLLDKHQERLLKIREAKPMLRIKIEKSSEKLSMIFRFLGLKKVA